jgi:putative FmdB family regulatory protein
VHVVPTYEYHCDGCGRDFEVKQRISEAPLTACDACGGSVRRLISPATFILKGEGWYVTDYPSASRKKALASEKEKSGDKTPAAPKEKSGAEKAAAAPDSASTSSSGSSSASAPSSPSSSD